MCLMMNKVLYLAYVCKTLLTFDQDFIITMKVGSLVPMHHGLKDLLFLPYSAGETYFASSRILVPI